MTQGHGVEEGRKGGAGTAGMVYKVAPTWTNN